MTEPLFSIVTVVRNDVAGLARTHGALKRQTSTDWEWIVVDGDSRDGGREWLDAHRKDISWGRSAPDRGLYDAMNIGLSEARGCYVLFLNAGDTLAAADTLDRFAVALDAAGMPDFCYGDSLETTSDGARLYKRARSHRHSWYGMFTHHQAMLYRMATVRGLLFDLAYPIGADYAFTIQALRRSSSVLGVPIPLCVFATGGISQTRAAYGRRDQSRIRKAMLGHGLVYRIAIEALQLLSWSIRQIAPSIFRMCRYVDFNSTCRREIDGAFRK